MQEKHRASLALTLVDVNVVNADVVVTDKNGRSVTGLRKEDFAVRGQS